MRPLTRNSGIFSFSLFVMGPTDARQMRHSQPGSSSPFFKEKYLQIWPLKLAKLINLTGQINDNFLKKIGRG